MGVNLIALVLLGLCSVAALAQPTQRHWTNDFEHLFTPTQIKQLDSISTRFQQQSGVEITVLTLDSTMVEGGDFAATVLHYAQVWASANPAKPMGVLWGLSKQLGRIQLQKSHGIAVVFSNAETQQFLAKTVTPNLQKGDFYNATREGLIELTRILMDKLTGKTPVKDNHSNPVNR